VFDGARIRLDGLTGDNDLYVLADMAYSRSSEGLHRATDPADVTVPDGWVVVSNVAATAAGPTWRFPPGPPLPSYLVALAAGPYRAARGEAAVPLGVYARRGVWDDIEADRLFGTLRTGIATFERMF
jgi:aminopeptidase N